MTTEYFEAYEQEQMVGHNFQYIMFSLGKIFMEIFTNK